MAKLLVQESNGSREFELVDVEVNIGRELDNSLRLADPSISRHHAVLRKTVAGYEIQDLGSSNGVLINGVKLDSGIIKDGDRVTLGQLQLTFLDPPALAASPLGTVRMSMADMAKIQAGDTAPLPVPPQPTTQMDLPQAGPPPATLPLAGMPPAPRPQPTPRAQPPRPATLPPHRPTPTFFQRLRDWFAGLGAK